jgi:hypothetical protein
MKVSENVIMDLMPMYLANEVSKDTRFLVEEYLQSHPEIADKYKQADIKLSEDVTIPLNKEDQLKAFMKVKQLQIKRTIVLSIVFSGGFLLLLAFIALLTRL